MQELWNEYGGLFIFISTLAIVGFAVFARDSTFFESKKNKSAK